jgi:kinetochore protein Nuf2
LPTNTFDSTRFANAARILDFNARDIATPTSERTRLILAAFINLMRFTQQRAGFVQSLREKSDGIIEERNKFSQELTAYREKIAVMKLVSSSSLAISH